VFSDYFPMVPVLRTESILPDSFVRPRSASPFYGRKTGRPDAKAGSGRRRLVDEFYGRKTATASSLTAALGTCFITP
jgi:hypothetical protein